MEEKKYYLMVIIGGALWGGIGLFVKLLAEAGISSLQITAVRSGFSMLCLGLFLLMAQREAFRIQWKDFYYFIGTGIFSLSFFNYCYFNAIALSSISVAVTLLYTAPIFVMMMSSLFLGEKFTRNKLLALIMTICGCILVTGVLHQQGVVSREAILFGLGSGFAYSLYSIFGKFALQKYQPMTVIFYTFLFATMGTFFVTDVPALIQDLSQTRIFYGAIGIAFFCTVLPYLFYTCGLKGIEPGKASILATVEPLVAAGIGIFIFHESAEWSKLLGMGLIFSSVLLVQRK